MQTAVQWPPFFCFQKQRVQRRFRLAACKIIYGFPFVRKRCCDVFAAALQGALNAEGFCIRALK
jgi:hypothetical protein